MQMDKQALLTELRQGEYRSGEQLGRIFGVSRAAVAKAVAKLRQEGCAIEAVPNRGYRLISEPDLLTGERILARLGDHPWRDRLLVLSSVDSTNNYLKTLAAAGAPHGTVVVADGQTGGRGRMGRRFDSAPGMGVYLSVLLRPACPPDRLMTLTAQAAVAAARAVEEVCGARTEIKWVNDLMLRGRKICGILTELSLEAESGLVHSAVVGVGINCGRRTEDFPPELRQIAGSILSQTGKTVDRGALAAALIRHLSALPELNWRGEYRARCLNLGRSVELLAPGREPVPALALDVGPAAELLVRLSDGTERAVNSGEVSIRGLSGPAEPRNR